MTFTQLAKVTGYERLFQVEGRATREEMWNWCLFLSFCNHDCDFFRCYRNRCGVDGTFFYE